VSCVAAPPYQKRPRTEAKETCKAPPHRASLADVVPSADSRNSLEAGKPVGAPPARGDLYAVLSRVLDFFHVQGFLRQVFRMCSL
jgi:hypothetical protein